MRVIIIFLGLLSAACQSGKTDWINSGRHEGLHQITYSSQFEIYSTDAHPKKVSNTIDHLEKARMYFDSIFGEELDFAVLFVDHQNWNKYAFAPPPGMPQAYFDGNMVLGLGQSAMANRWKQELIHLPAGDIDSLHQIFGEDLDLDLFFRDALSLHELGHLYQYYKTGEKSQRRWLSEVFGNLCQVAAAHHLDNLQVLSRMDYFQSVLVKNNLWGAVTFKSLGQFENSYLEIINQGKNYGWYQTQFYFKARKLYSVFGDQILIRLRNFLIATDMEKVGHLDDLTLNKELTDALGEEAVECLRWEYHN